MKRRIAILTLLFVMLIGNSNAQWYKEEYGVSDINDLTETQLRTAFVKAQKKRDTGLILTVFGAGTVVGGIALLDGIECGQSGEEVLGRLFFGLILDAGGVVMTSIGIPMLISYSKRLLQIKDATNYGRPKNTYLSITPLIDYNKYTNTYSSGITFTLNF